MKTIALFIVLIAASFVTKAQDPFFDQQFRGFQIYFETLPVPNQAGQISVLYPACRIPYSENFPEFPTETQITGQLITVTYAFRIPNPILSCFSGRVERYPLPVLQQGAYQLKVNARLIDRFLGPLPRIVETRTLAQINFQVETPLVTQVPNLTPAGFALMSLMMLGVGAYLTGRRAT